MSIRLLESRPDGEFDWRWPSRNVEHFDRTWIGRVAIQGSTANFRHAIGRRDVYGRPRVHSVTWIGTSPRVEGAEADDYPRSRSLVSVLRRSDKKHARVRQDMPPGYDTFQIVSFRSEIDGPFAPRALAVKIAEDDLDGWVTHAALRAMLFGKV